ncbi:MAG: asparagine synthase-related protein [Henriciella sp.]|nr:asparagine synthase-related protein [Henriciella sp.]
MGRAQFRSAFETLGAYGSDHSELNINGGIGVGCHHLRVRSGPISDSPSASQQSVIVVADAILDNRAELAKSLSVSDEALTALSDTELIWRSFLRWGKDCVQYLEGDYAFACIDTDRRAVFLARDHIGSRPLYWALRGETFLFGTSVEALVGFSDLQWSIDEEVIAEYLFYPVTPVSKPFFQDLHSVLPGGYVQLDQGQVTTERWWDPSDKVIRRIDGKDDVVAECRRLLDDAVIKRIQTSRPVGSHFSGGLDSTGVGVIASRYLRSKGQQLAGAYAWSPPVSEDYPDDHARDERPFIDAIAEAESIPLRFGAGDSENFLEFINRPMEFENETDLADELPILQAARSDQVGTMLSGWAGDEAFSSHGRGYLGYLILRGRFATAKKFVHFRYKSLKNLPLLMSLMWWEVVHPLLPTGLYHRLGRYQYFSEDFLFASMQLSKRHGKLRQRRRNSIKFTLNPNRNLKRHLQAGHVNRRMESWAAWSAPYGFQYRYPLADRQLLEFLLTLPPEELFLDTTPRGLARAVLADCVPPEASKEDIANERLRYNTRVGAWNALAESAEAGGYADECPWIDKAAFLEALKQPLDQNDKSYIVTFASITAAARVWALYRRAKRYGWV